jgi:hypothetical protein
MTVNSMLKPLLLLALILPCTQLQAADFSVDRQGKSYSLEVSGTIHKGDLDTLTEIIKGKNSFPTITRLSGAGGDPVEAMKIGQLYRQAHLSAIAADQCESACFLWLMGAVSRSSTTDFVLNLPAPELRDETRQYLEAMGAPALLADDITSTIAPASYELSAKRFDEWVGERPLSFHEWQLEQCGEATDIEKMDYRRMQAAGFLRVLETMREVDPGRVELTPIIERYREMNAQAAVFPQEYKILLLDKFEEIRVCRRERLLQWQREALAQL